MVDSKFFPVVIQFCGWNGGKVRTGYDECEIK